MSVLNRLLKAGIAKKALDEARKPQNQEKAKELFAQLNQKYKSRTKRSPQ